MLPSISGLFCLAVSASELDFMQAALSCDMPSSNFYTSLSPDCEHAGFLQPRRVQKLNQLGVSWQPVRTDADMLWDARLTELMLFRREHGHVRVSDVCSTPGKLTCAVTCDCLTIRDVKPRVLLSKEQVADARRIDVCRCHHNL